ncbi:MAG TPA: hypothetical protein VJ731_13510 [Terriglobales bacterium]|nr:hypothetical protein [Terriglobales bacterium]
MKRLSCVVSFLLLALAGSTHIALAQNTGKMTTIDGGAGGCSLEVTVLGTDGKPAYAATVKVHISYGFAGTRRLDLEAGTNNDGKVKFTGLPSRVHRPPLEFIATKDQMQAMLTYDPSAECEAKHEMTLHPKPTETQPSESP